MWIMSQHAPVLASDPNTGGSVGYVLRTRIGSSFEGCHSLISNPSKLVAAILNEAFQRFQSFQTVKALHHWTHFHATTPWMTKLRCMMDAPCIGLNRCRRSIQDASRTKRDKAYWETRLSRLGDWLACGGGLRMVPNVERF